MSSCDTQRATSVSGRLVAFIAALMIALTTLFATTAVPQSAIAADDAQTNFDSWTAAAKNIEDQLATAEKDYNDGNYGQAGTDFQTAHWIGYDASNFSKVVNDTISADKQKELLQQFTDLEGLAYQQDQGDAIAAKIDALTAEINATAQTLDATSPILRNMRSSVPRKPRKSARSSTRPRRIHPKAKATARGVRLPAK